MVTRFSALKPKRYSNNEAQATSLRCRALSHKTTQTMSKILPAQQRIRAAQVIQRVIADIVCDVVGGKISREPGHGGENPFISSILAALVSIDSVVMTLSCRSTRNSFTTSPALT